MNFHESLDNIDTDIHQATSVRSTFYLNVTKIILAVIPIIDRYEPVYTKGCLFHVTRENKLFGLPLHELYVLDSNEVVLMSDMTEKQVDHYLTGDKPIYKLSGKLFASGRSVSKLTRKPDPTYILMAVISIVLRAALDDSRCMILYPNKVPTLDSILDLSERPPEHASEVQEQVLEVIDPILADCEEIMMLNPESPSTVYRVGLSWDGSRIKFDRLGSIYEFQILEIDRQKEYLG